jgi:hypothetical protein
LHYFDEETIGNGTIDEMCTRIKDKYGDNLGTCIIRGDYNGNNKSMSEPDKASNYKLIKRKLNLRDNNFDLRANPLHTNSRTDCNYIYHNFPDFRVAPKCVNFVRDLENVEIDESGSIIKKNRQKTEQRADHLDAHRYDVNGSDIQRWIKDNQKKR